MISCKVGLSRMVSAEDLKELVGELGGEWHQQEGGCQGVIEEAGTRVWADPPCPADESVCEPGEMEIVRRHDVVSIVKVIVTHEQGSPGLSSRVIGVMLRRWGGIEIEHRRLCSPDDWW